MYYGDIKHNDIANGIGVRVSLFVSGCTHYCRGCFNSEAWDFTYGKPYTNETELTILSSMNREEIAGITLLGGEPMNPKNVSTVSQLIHEVRRSFGNTKTVWIYSGYLYEDLKERNCIHTNTLLNYADVLVDGKFDELKSHWSLQFRGSSNQRIIDLNETRKGGKTNGIKLYRF